MDTLMKNNSIVSYANDEVIKVCVQRGEHVYSKGIWLGDDPFLYVLPTLLLQVILSGLLSRAIYCILRPFKQPKIVCNILGGIILGPSVIGKSAAFMNILYLPKELIVLRTFGYFGAYFYLFVTCVKMDISMITRSSKSVWTISLLSVCTGCAMNLAACVYLKKQITAFSRADSYFLAIIAAALTGGHFQNMAYALDELNLLASEWGQLALSCTMINELFWWVAELVFTLLKVKGIKFIYTLVCVALILFLGYGLRCFVLWIVKITPEGRPVKRMFVVAVWLIALFMGFISSVLIGNFITGVVIAGFVVPDGPPLGSAIVERTEHILSEVFLPMFHLVIGHKVEISIMSLKDFLLLHLIILMGIVGKMLGCFVACGFFNIRQSNAAKFGLILSLKGIVELIVFDVLRRKHFIDDSTYSSAVIAVTLVAAIITPLVETSCKPFMRLDLPSSFPQVVTSLQSTSRKRELRILSCINVEDNLNSFLPLLDAFIPTPETPLCVYIIHLVELIGSAAPELVPHSLKGKGFIPSSSDRIMRACQKYTRSFPGSMIVQLFTLVAPYKSMHETICRVVQDHLIPLIIVPFHKNQQYDGTTGHLRLFNTNTQASASCTVGILVDRGPHCRVRSNNMPFKVCLIFLGGPDDREALAFGKRLSSQDNVVTTVMRIDFYEYSKEENRSDRLLDQMVLEDFKAANDGNPSVVYRYVMAVEPMEVIRSVRSLEGDYDIVVVGQRRGNDVEIEFEDDMVDWVEYPELGIIGDELLSLNFNGGSIPALVLRSSGGVCPVQRSKSKGSRRSTSK